MSQQLFTPGANTIARLSVVAAGLVAAIVLTYLLVRMHSPYTKAPVGIAVNQPVRFSHELHAGQLNVDCRYCHTSVEKTAYAGIPDTYTCMTCHSQVARYSELLQPVRDSYDNNTRIAWNKVHELAQHVYFNHSIHVNKGIGCESCHGRVDQMPMVWRNETMTMRWCLDCHQEPQQQIRPREEVYTFGYTPAEEQATLGPRLIEEYHVQVDGLTDCAVCHR
jgi:hypothetical protein